MQPKSIKSSDPPSKGCRHEAGNALMSVKRTFDVGLSLLLLILLAPLLAITALIVALFLGRPVLFRQQRPGLNGEPFILLKFRSMRDVFDTDGRPLPDSERLTRLGRALRRTSLDELPELINVLRGDMSLVGPRPLLMEYLSLYTEEQARRHEMRPGITGWAQINGRNALDWEEKFRLDVWYVDNHSLLLDLRILLRTVGDVLLARDVSRPGHVSMERFRGSQR